MLLFATASLVQPGYRSARLRSAAPVEFAAYAAARENVTAAISGLQDAHFGMWNQYQVARHDASLASGVVRETRASVQRQVLAARDEAVARLEAATVRLREAHGAEREKAASEVRAATEAISAAVMAAAQEGGESIRQAEREQSAVLTEAARRAERWFRRNFPAEWTAFREASQVARQTEERLWEIAPREWEAYMEFSRP